MLNALSTACPIVQRVYHHGTANLFGFTPIRLHIQDTTLTFVVVQLVPTFAQARREVGFKVDVKIRGKVSVESLSFNV